MDHDFQLAEDGDVSDVEPGDWVAERKLDGVRALAVDGKLVTRSGNHIQHKLPEIDVPDDVVLDGEVVTEDFEFSSVLGRTSVEDTFKIKMRADELPASLSSTFSRRVVRISGSFRSTNARNISRLTTCHTLWR